MGDFAANSGGHRRGGARLQTPADAILERDDIIFAIRRREAAGHVGHFLARHVVLPENTLLAFDGRSAGPDESVAGDRVVRPQVSDDACSLRGRNSFEVNRRRAPGGVLDDPFHPARAILRRDVRGVLQPNALAIPYQREHEVAENGLVAAYHDVGFVAAEGHGGQVIAVEGTIAVPLTVVSNESVSLHDVSGRFKCPQINSILSSGEKRQRRCRQNGSDKGKSHGAGHGDHSYRWRKSGNIIAARDGSFPPSCRKGVACSPDSAGPT